MLGAHLFGDFCLHVNWRFWDGYGWQLTPGQPLLHLTHLDLLSRHDLHGGNGGVGPGHIAEMLLSLLLEIR